MWYPPRQYCQQLQQQISHGYISDLSPHKQQQQHNCSRTSYYRSTDESPIANRTITSVVLRNDDDESFIHYHATYTDDAYGRKKIFIEQISFTLETKADHLYECNNLLLF